MDRPERTDPPDILLARLRFLRTYERIALDELESVRLAMAGIRVDLGDA